MLSNLLYNRAKNTKRRAKHSFNSHLRDIPRVQTPPSPASFASPEIFDIQDRQATSFDFGNAQSSRSSDDDDTQAGGHASKEDGGEQKEDAKSVSPQVHLNFRNSGNLSDWFPTGMLKSDDPVTLGNNHGNHEAGAAHALGSGSGEGSSSALGSGSANSSGGVKMGFGFNGEDETMVVVPEKREAASFVDLADSEDGHGPALADDKERALFHRKAAPAPIRIPLLPGQDPSHSGKDTLSVKQARRHARNLSSDSMPDSPEGSAISGTTLARALIANSFILSNNEVRTSRHRSGMISRQDSATLPRGENPLLNSPYFRDRRLSNAGDTPAYDDGASTPPVPPMPVPPPTGLLLIAQKGNRHHSVAISDAQAREMARNGVSTADLARRLSASSRRSSVEDHPPPRPSLSRGSSLNNKLTTGEAQSSRRISRISEAPSPAPTAPPTPQKDPNSARGSDSGGQDADLPTSDQGSDELVVRLTPSIAAEFGIKPTSGGSHETRMTEPPSSAESGQELADVLENFQFVEPSPPHHGETQAAPTTASPSTSTYQDLGRKDSKKYRRSNKVNLPIRGGRIDWTLPRAGSDSRVLTLGSSRDSGSKRTISLLPIGERPTSLHAPHSPATPGFLEVKHTSTTSRNTAHLRVSSTSTNATTSATMLPTSKPSSVKTAEDAKAEGADPKSEGVSEARTSDVPAQSPPGSPDILDSMLASRPAFTRKRSGSTPNPVRPSEHDSDEEGVVEIPFRHEPQSATSSTPNSSGSGSRQTFPETPSAFSPLWSSSMSSVSPMQPSSGESVVFALPQSARASGPALSLAQTVALSRATTVSGASAATRSRQNSHLRRPSSPGSMAERTDLLSPIGEDERSEDASPARLSRVSSQSGSGSHHSDGVSSKSVAPSTHTVAPPLSAINKDLPAVPTSSPESSDTVVELSQVPERDRPVVAEEVVTVAVPTPPQRRTPTPDPPAQPTAVAEPAPSAAIAETAPPPFSQRTPAPDAPPSSFPRMASSSSDPQSQSSDPGARHRDSHASSEFTPSYVAPPPYQTAILSPKIENDEHHNPILAFVPPTDGPRYQAPGTGSLPPSVPPVPTSAPPTIPAPISTPVPPPTPVPTPGPVPAPAPAPIVPDSARGPPASARPGFSVMSSPAATTQRTNPTGGSKISNVNGRTARLRPPLPIGPRKPSIGAGQISGAAGGRDRSGSTASVTNVSTPGQASNPNWRNLSQEPGSAPKFQTSQPKWRGLTMDAAKWTFTSQQLQAIVSRAIKYSAEASAIRLLTLEALDQEIPKEMRRLEERRAELKTRYKVLTRKRWTLLGSLSSMIESNQMHDSAAAMRLVENLAECSTALDQTTEELHDVMDQAGKLKSLCDVHSASALAMALRKLNSSFLSKVAENDLLRHNNEQLEAERDEAWKQAEDIAHDFDELNEKISSSIDQAGASTSASRPASSVRSSKSLRSSRVSAARKSGMRVSKAGLRTSTVFKRSRPNSSASANRTSYGPTSAGSSTAMPVPPVPSLPQPLEVSTANLAGRSSVVLSSSSPTEDSRALAHAQKELYAILGIPLDGRRRTRSINGPLTGLSDRSSFSQPQRPLSDISTPGHYLTTFPRSPESRGFRDVDRKSMLVTLDLMNEMNERSGLTRI